MRSLGIHMARSLGKRRPAVCQSGPRIFSQCHA
jgi:hypothetical protein